VRTLGEIARGGVSLRGSRAVSTFFRHREVCNLLPARGGWHSSRPSRARRPGPQADISAAETFALKPVLIGAQGFRPETPKSCSGRQRLEPVGLQAAGLATKVPWPPQSIGCCRGDIRVDKEPPFNQLPTSSA
jgi:hypothetical protein